MDWNNDGMVDLLFGSGCGNVYYYQRLADGSLQQMPNIKSGSSFIDVGYISCPAIYDWNDDGLMDLLVGREFLSGGSIRLYENTGTLGDPSFSGYQPVSSSSGQIQKWRSAPQMGDLDGDDLDDLVLAACGSGSFDIANDGPNWGWVYFYRNIGTESSPLFDDPVKLYGGEELIYNYHHNICLFDWNNDGSLDILSGDFDGDIRLYISSGTQGFSAENSSEFGFSIENPSASQCTLQFSNATLLPGRVDLFTTAGRRADPGYTLDIPSGTSSYSFDVSSLSVGTYLVSFTSTAGEMALGKVVILH